ncbi:MAG: hypothetical protein ACOCTT_00900 [archaeon]
MPIKEIFNEKKGETPFIIFTSFLASFLASRIYVYFFTPGFTGRDIFPFEQYMIHHFYYGIALIIIAGWISIVHKNRSLNRLSALFYGLGLGIFFDEIGFLLTYFTDYWSGITYTIVIIISSLMLNFIFFADFWKEVNEEVKRFSKKHNLTHGPWNLIGLINILDEVETRMSRTRKVATAFIGLIFIITGMLVISYPTLIQYWVGGAFILSGVGYIIQLIKRD